MKKPVKKINPFSETGSLAASTLKPGDKARVKYGILSGVIVTVIKNFDNRGYIMELPDGRQYLYDPVEIDPV